MSNQYKVSITRNLLDSRLFSTGTTNGVTFTLQEDGSIHAHGEASAVTTSSASGFILPAGTYTMSGAPAGSAVLANDMFLIRSYDGALLARSHDGTNQATFTLAENTELVVYIRVPVGSVSAVFYPQLETGSEATDYVPYKYIEKIYKRSYVLKKDYRKNLLPPFAEAVSSLGITITPLEDGGLHITGTVDEGYPLVTIPSPFDGSALKGDMYTYSVRTDTPVSGSALQVRLMDASGAITATSNILVNSNLKYVNVSYDGMQSVAQIGVRLGSGITYDHVIYLQIEEGDIATEYAPYRKNICPGVENGIAYSNASGGDYVSANYCRTLKMPITEGVTYAESVSNNIADKYRTYHFWDADGNWLGYSGYSLNNRPAGAAMMGISYYHQDTSKIIEWVQVEAGSTATEYEPYEVYGFFAAEPESLKKV